MIENPTSCTAQAIRSPRRRVRSRALAKLPDFQAGDPDRGDVKPGGLGKIEVAEAGNGQVAGHIDATAPTGEDHACSEPVDHAKRSIRVGMGSQQGIQGHGTVGDTGDRHG